MSLSQVWRGTKTAGFWVDAPAAASWLRGLHVQLLRSAGVDDLCVVAHLPAVSCRRRRPRAAVGTHTHPRTADLVGRRTVLERTADIVGRSPYLTTAAARCLAAAECFSCSPWQHRREVDSVSAPEVASSSYLNTLLAQKVYFTQ